MSCDTLEVHGWRLFNPQYGSTLRCRKMMVGSVLECSRSSRARDVISDLGMRLFGQFRDKGGLMEKHRFEVRDLLERQADKVARSRANKYLKLLHITGSSAYAVHILLYIK